MKKLIAFAAVLAMALSLSAAAVPWTKTNLGELDTNLQFDNTKGTYFAAIVTLNYSKELTGGGRIVSFLPKKGKENADGIPNGTIVLRAPDKGVYDVSARGNPLNGETGTFFQQANLSKDPAFNDKGTHKLGIALKHGTLKNHQAAFLRIFFDGHEFDQTNIGHGDWSVASIVAGNNQDAKVTGLWVTTENVTSADMLKQMALLPEPTVLALLALGVAGVALKRRIA